MKKSVAEQPEKGPSTIDLVGEDLVKKAVEKGASLPQIRRRIEAEQARQNLLTRLEARANEYLESNGERGDWRAARLVLTDKSDEFAHQWRQKGEIDEGKREEVFNEWMKVQDQLDVIDKGHGSLRDQFDYAGFATEFLLRQAFPLTRESEYFKGILG